MAASLQMIRVQFAMERPAAHSELPGRLSSVAIAFLEGADDELFFGFLDCHLALQPERSSAAAPRSGVAHSGWQIPQGNPFTPSEHDRVLDRGPQFTNVARPGMIPQRLHGFTGQ